MAYEVAVALVGDRSTPGPGGLHEGEWQWSWEARQQVTLTVREDETVGSVMDRAASELDVPSFMYGTPPSESFTWIAFHDESATTPLYQRKLGYGLTIVDDQDRAIWNVAFGAARYSQVVRSAELGLIQGDPLRLYLIRQQQAGGFGGIDWHTFLELYGVARLVLNGIGDARTSIENVRAAGRVIERGVATITRHLPEWTQRGVVAPADVSRSIGDTAATVSARVLGVDVDEVGPLAQLLGAQVDAEVDPDTIDPLTIVHDEIHNVSPEAMHHGYDIARLFEDRLRERLTQGPIPPTPLEPYRIPIEVLFPGSPPDVASEPDEERFTLEDMTDHATVRRALSFGTVAGIAYLLGRRRR